MWFFMCFSQKFPRLKGRHGGNLANILRGTDSVCEDQKEELLGILDDCIKASMDELYHDKVMEKIDEIIGEAGEEG